MDKSSKFSVEIDYINNDKLKSSLIKFINMLPDYFFEVEASSTGKYHPEYALGDGGLLRHTKAAARIGYELLSNELIGGKYTMDERDLMIIAILVHDGLKHGIVKEQYVKFDHPIVMANFIKDNGESFGFSGEEIDFIAKAVSTHMGPFTKDYRGNEVLSAPKTKYESFVHMCDYLASRKFLLVPFDDENNITC